jgi:gliding motility-associated-like protein
VDDGSCEYNVFGCTDEDALNYDPNATTDDGSCIFPPPFDPCDDVEVFAPNTFTPNNDGLNDAWYVITDEECWREWKVQVYNRWGSLVWESFNPNDKWNGSNNGSDYFVADGVYVYTIIGNKWNTDAVTLSGHLTILR